MRFGVSGTVRGGGDRLRADAQAFLASLSRLSGHSFELVACRDYRQLLNDLLSDRLTLAWLPPMLHAPASERRAQLLATCERNGALTYRAVLLVRGDSGFRSLRSLRRARFAWTDPQSAAGYHFPRMMFESLGFQENPDFNYQRFYGSSLAAAQAVVNREADLCTCYVADTDASDRSAELTATLGPMARDLRVVDTTETIPCDALFACPSMDPEPLESLKQAIRTMTASPLHRAVTNRLFDTDVLHCE